MKENSFFSRPLWVNKQPDVPISHSSSSPVPPYVCSLTQSRSRTCNLCLSQSNTASEANVNWSSLLADVMKLHTYKSTHHTVSCKFYRLSQPLHYKINTTLTQVKPDIESQEMVTVQNQPPVSHYCPENCSIFHHHDLAMTFLFSSHCGTIESDAWTLDAILAFMETFTHIQL